MNIYDWILGKKDDIEVLSASLSRKSNDIKKLLNEYLSSKNKRLEYRKLLGEKISEIHSIYNKYKELSIGYSFDFPPFPDIRYSSLKKQIIMVTSFIKKITSKNFKDNLRKEISGNPFKYEIGPKGEMYTTKDIDKKLHNLEPSPQNRGIGPKPEMIRDIYHHKLIPKTKEVWTPYFYAPPRMQDRKNVWQTKTKSEMTRDIINAILDSSNFLPNDLKKNINGLIREISRRSIEKIAFSVDDVYSIRKNDIITIIDNFFKKILGSKYDNRISDIKPFKDSILSKMVETWDKEFEEIKDAPKEKESIQISPIENKMKNQDSITEQTDLTVPENIDKENVGIGGFIRERKEVPFGKRHDKHIKGKDALDVEL